MRAARLFLFGSFVGAFGVGGGGAANAQDVYHEGYMRSDGTYVAPHFQSAPDHSSNDNWTASPNVDPHTGAQGTDQPFNDRPPRSGGFYYPNFGR
jgi:hypothetical protein